MDNELMELENDEIMENGEDEDESFYRLMAVLVSSAEKLLELENDEDIDALIGNDPGIAEAIEILHKEFGDVFVDEDDEHDARVLVHEVVIFLYRLIRNLSEKGRNGLLKALNIAD